MPVLVIADSNQKSFRLRSLLTPCFEVTSASLTSGVRQWGHLDAAIIAADIRIVDNIAAVKEVIAGLGEVRKRIFLIDVKTHLSIAQAYALGATSVLLNPVTLQELLAQLVDRPVAEISPADAAGSAKRVADAAATTLSSMFSAVHRGRPVDLAGVEAAAGKIVDSVMDDGLTNWLATVREHHEGTYQHCLLVSGIAVDFGVSIGASRTDIERLAVAATFHDIGKARIPLAVLDKPGRLEPGERAVIETHAAAGYDVLSGTPGISDEILDAVRHHHEFLDGSGYPDGLEGSSISDIVRILTISDIFAALIEQRQYKPCMPRDEAYDILCKMRGRLEPALVLAFKDVALGR
jgi:putative nucleotidyltransferase with HDIG domain